MSPPPLPPVICNQSVIIWTSPLPPFPDYVMYVRPLNEWTKKKELNEKKYQYTTKHAVNYTPIEIVKEPS
jgi:hypothetical protein